MKNKESETQNNILPKSMWRFYMRYAIPGSVGAMIVWAIAFFIVSMDGVLFPNFQRWFIALFENPVPAGMTFMQHALPTIITIVVLLLLIDISMLLRDMFYSRWGPVTQNRIWIKLSDYVYNQSMSFWTGRMAGKVHTQIMYVAKGFDAIIDFWRLICLMAVIAINVGLIFSIH